MAKDKGKVRLVKDGDRQSDLQRTFETAVDLSAATRVAMIELLNRELADTADLYSQTKQAHWNVKGIHFYPLHLLFDQLAEKRQGEADELAERATDLGGYALGTVRMAAASSSLPEIPTDINTGADYVRALVERYGIHANTMRAAIDNADEAGRTAASVAGRPGPKENSRFDLTRRRSGPWDRRAAAALRSRVARYHARAARRRRKRSCRPARAGCARPSCRTRA